MQKSKEIWKAVVGFEDIYEVSSRGRVKRVAAGRGAIAGRLLKPWKHKIGYMQIEIGSSRTDRKTLKVHRVEAEAFFGPCPEGLEVNHKDGDKSNNYVENLEYRTHQYNCWHRSRVLKKAGPRGEKHGNAKLTKDDVREVRRISKLGFAAHKIGYVFNIATVTVYDVVARRSWKHVA